MGTPLAALVDSDCTVTPGWLEPLLAQFADDRVALVAPRVVTPGRDGGPLRSIDAYERVRSPLDLGRHPALVRADSPVTYVPAATMLVRVEALAALGGFDPDLRTGEDVDLVWRMTDAGHRVRYVPTARVEHEVRGTFAGWARQRWSYGASAASLDARHCGRVAPVVVSPWSAAVCGLVLSGHPGLGATVAGITSLGLGRSLSDLPRSEVARIGMGGHLGAARQLARALVRVWWPIGIGAAMLSRRARRVGVAALAVSVASAWVEAADRGAVEVDPLRFALLSIADDLSYGAGVWTGCVRARSFGPLRPRSSTLQRCEPCTSTTTPTHCPG